MRLRFWWFSARNGTTIISNHVLFIFLLNNFFENLLMNSFVYFLLLYCYWSVLCQDGGTSVDIQSRLNEARNAFMSLRSVWRSASYSTKTKLRIYQSCVLSTLLYGSECWRMTEQDLSKLASFHTANLRKILRIFWPQKISNDQLLRQTKQEDIRTLVNRRRWRWIGHVMRKASNNIARIATRWTPEGKRSRGRPKTTWRRTVEKRLRGLNFSCSTIEKLAKDRQGWKDFVADLCATQALWVVSK